MVWEKDKMTQDFCCAEFSIAHKFGEIRFKEDRKSFTIIIAKVDGGFDGIYRCNVCPWCGYHWTYNYK
jgi:hypothetical protein